MNNGRFQESSETLWTGYDHAPKEQENCSLGLCLLLPPAAPSQTGHENRGPGEQDRRPVDREEDREAGCKDPL